MQNTPKSDTLLDSSIYKCGMINYGQINYGQIN